MEPYYFYLAALFRLFHADCRPHAVFVYLENKKAYGLWHIQIPLMEGNEEAPFKAANSIGWTAPMDDPALLFPGL